jgi:hypothetical protein
VKLSAHFDLKEFAVSGAHPELVVQPPEFAVTKLKRLAETVLEPARVGWGKPFHILSGYRSPTLNAKVGGSPTSQHVRGEAADITTDDTKGYFRWLMGQKIPLGQCIWYPAQNFVHHALPSPRFPKATFCIHDPARGWHYLVLSGVADLDHKTR